MATSLRDKISSTPGRGWPQSSTTWPPALRTRRASSARSSGSRAAAPESGEGHQSGGHRAAARFEESFGAILLVGSRKGIEQDGDIPYRQTDSHYVEAHPELFLPRCRIPDGEKNEVTSTGAGSGEQSRRTVRG